MSQEIWIAYIVTILVFMSTPGPSHLLMLSNSLAHGFKRSVATAIGDLSANFIQMLLAIVGLVGLIKSASDIFFYIKWMGVIYLIYLGISLFFKKQQMTKEFISEISQRKLFAQGFITSIANPKAIIFFAALFPQFINPEINLMPQFIVLSISYLVIDGCFLCCYGKFADLIIKKLKNINNRTVNKIAGSIYIFAAVLLGMKDMTKS